MHQTKGCALGEGSWTKKYGDRIQSAILCYGVSGLGKSAFSECKVLCSVMLSDGLVSFESYVFEGCGLLTEVCLRYFQFSIHQMLQTAFNRTGTAESVL